MSVSERDLDQRDFDYDSESESDPTNVNDTGKIVKPDPDIQETVQSEKLEELRNTSHNKMGNKMELREDANFMSTAFRDDIPKLQEEMLHSVPCNSGEGAEGVLPFEKPKTENLRRELRQLKKHSRKQEATIDLIMTKYRQHVSELTKLKTESDLKVVTTRQIALQIISEESRKGIEKVEEMKRVLTAALSSDENIFLRSEGLLAQLVTENKHLRELLAVSTDLTQHVSTKNTDDKSVQTDNYEDDLIERKESEITCTNLGSGDVPGIDDAEETENEESGDECCSDDSGSFYSAIDIDSDSC